MFKRIRGERGFTLIELLVVLAILAILIAIVVPNLTGFLGRGKESSFNADRDTIQAAVDGYYTDSNLGNHWPTAGGGTGDNPTGDNAYIDFEDLVNNRFLEDEPASSNITYNTGGASGSYGWYIDSLGRVQGGNTDDAPGYNGNYP